jgi:hypothetical protein
LLAAGDAPTAETAAQDAHQRAGAADCQFLWGAAEAGHLLGQARAMQGRSLDACTILEATRDLREQLGDPKLESTERLLKTIR